MSGLRIGTRASALALAQTRSIVDMLAGGEIVTVTTSGDLDSSGSHPAGSHPAGGFPAGSHPPSGDKSRWVDAIEDALLAGEIDLAVHSAKDLPGELPDGLELLGGPPRAPAEDVVCLAGGTSADHDKSGSVESERGTLGAVSGQTGIDCLDALPEGARIGTSSIRRAAQLRATRADLNVVAIGGNVDTRLRVLADGRFDAIVLARAGLRRLGRERAIAAVLDPARFVPAPGQGTLALEARAGDSRVREAVAAILDADASACLLAERALASALGASCHTPLGAHATPAGCGCLGLRAWVGLPDGSAWVADELLGGFYDPTALGRRMAERMSAAGARELLQRAEEMAAVVGA